MSTTIFLIATLKCFFINLGVIRFFSYVSFKDHSVNEIQAAHKNPTPRFGGIAIFMTFFLVGIVYKLVDFKLFFSCFPLFIIGLAEDLKKEIKPSIRLLFGSLSAVASILWFCSPIQRIDLLPIEFLLNYYSISLIFTVFSIVGMVNALNMIDGINGFSAIHSIIMLSSIGFIAYSLNNEQILSVSILMISVILGFLFLNFPKGWIFLGDTGPYLIGLIIASLVINLHNNNISFNSWSVLLIIFWPVSEALLSIYRRLQKGIDTKQADFLHYHHVVMKLIEKNSGYKIGRETSNPLATIILVPISSLPTFIGAVYFDDPEICLAAFLIFFFLFIGTYFLFSKNLISP